MAYQVLALKYRPQTFDEVVGQRAVVQTLKNSLLNDRIGHAYLFSGVRGVGKTTVARLLAKALNCVKGPTPTPCNECSSCIEIGQSRSLDVLEIDGASNNSVDDVRELRDTARYAPSRDRNRIFIIDEVHMLSNSAFNALLKTLEEPPPRVVFIFATTEYRKIPVTILSRCQHFDFKRIAQGDIADHLGRIAASEKVTISPYALSLIARMADGSLRDGQSALDQVIAYCGSVVRDEDARAILGVLDREILAGFVEKVADRDSAGLLSLVDQVLESGHDPALFLGNLMEQVRDLLLMKIVPDPVKSLGLAQDEVSAFAPLKERFSQEDLLRIMDAIAREEARIRYSPQPRYLLEALAVRLCHLTHLEPLEELLARFPDSAAGATPGGGKPPAPKPEKPGPRRSSTPAADAAFEAGSVSINPLPSPAGGPPSLDLPVAAAAEAPPEIADAEQAPVTMARGGDEAPEARAQVEAILERIHTERSALWGFLSHASFFDLTGDAFVISLPEDKALFRASIERKEYLAVIRSVVESVTGKKVEVRVQQTAALPADAAPSLTAVPAADAAAEEKKRRLLEEATKSPEVRSLLDLFEGEIIEIEEA
ncbi:MAG TPA: DNA polymerase III subunit gamma/tau [Candidatus Polarisedimenticolia bacterium]|nr:DNA polymerase III subunit gamma/tau [Candidatus Polarisedimenticolia bacterium]